MPKYFAMVANTERPPFSKSLDPPMNNTLNTEVQKQNKLQERNFKQKFFSKHQGLQNVL